MKLMRWLLVALGIACAAPAAAQPASTPVVPGYLSLLGCPPGQGTPCFVPNVSGNAGSPPGSTPVANSATGTTGAVVATLPAASGQFTYLCNFSINAAGTATISPITIAGVQGGSIVLQGLSAGGAPFFPPPFSPCLRSNAVNTAITITTTADGTATAVDAAASGFQQ